jgi:P22_AR N-terminal domain
MAEIVAKRLVDHLERARFVVMKRPPIGGGAALGRGFEGQSCGRGDSSNAPHRREHGLDWAGQHAKLLEQKSKFLCMDIHTRDSLGREQEMLAMPVEKLPLWLASINPNKIQSETNPARVEHYRAESAVAGYATWTGLSPASIRPSPRPAGSLPRSLGEFPPEHRSYRM